MRIYKVLPDLSKERHMKIWHKALRSQWSATDLDWQRPLGIRSRRLKDLMGRILTPILMGEQAALYSVSGLIPILGQRAEVESQFYLTTWAVDEARHTELFTLFYDRIDRQPLSIRKFPTGYLFQSQIAAKDPGTWLSGVLVSEVLAKLVMEEFMRLDIDPVLSDISEGILKDEARHLGFNHIYLEDRFQALFSADPSDGETESTSLRQRLSEVLGQVPPMLQALAAELREVGIDSEGLFHNLSTEAAGRLEKAVRAGRRIATGEADPSRTIDAAIIGA